MRVTITAPCKDTSENLLPIMEDDAKTGDKNEKEFQ